MGKFLSTGRPHYIAPAVIGAIIPDFMIFVFFIVETFILKTSQKEMWDVKYFLPSWQFVINIFNSIVFIVVLLIVGLCINKNKSPAYFKTRTWFLGISISMLLHIISDFFLHHSDGHAHFFPFSNFVFNSPISYWEKTNHGALVSTIELIFTLLASVVLYKQLSLKKSKLALILLTTSQVATYIMWFTVMV